MKNSGMIMMNQLAVHQAACGCGAQGTTPGRPSTITIVYSRQWKVTTTNTASALARSIR